MIAPNALVPDIGFRKPTASRLRKVAVMAVGCLVLSMTLNSCAWMFPNRIIQSHTSLSYAADKRSLPIHLRTQDIEKLRSLCLTKYNYWCVKTPGNSNWNGQVGKDLAGHAIFKDPVYAARAFTRIMRTYHRKHKLRTAREIISRYAPSSDCIGSRGYCPVHDYYKFGVQGLPYGKIGNQWVQYSKKKISGFVEGGECTVKLMYCPLGFNPVNDYASAIAKAVGKGPDEDLQLFDDQGRINLEVAVPLFTAFSRWELGASYRVKSDLIVRGAMLEHRDYFRS